MYRSSRRGDCAERAFVLDALGIESHLDSEIDAGGVRQRLTVDDADAPRALEQLAAYERERLAARELERRPAPPEVRLSDHPHAWLGCAAYAAVLIGIALMIANGWGRLDAFTSGELDAGRVQGGQWWRAWTALTLHLDGAHLAANLAGGIWFGYLAGSQLGAGHAWLLTVTGAACANLLEALLGPPTHVAVGASTAVFTALGVLSAYAWRLRVHTGRRWPQRWALQWAPLVGGVVLLAWTGSGGEDTGAPVDVVAHALGFGTGAALGALAATLRVRRLLQRLPQWASGLAALAQIAAAWGFALRS